VYPGKEHSVYMKEDELRKFSELVGWRGEPNKRFKAA
jgi:hypothetical protein